MFNNIGQRMSLMGSSNAGFFIWLDLRPFMGANDSDRWDAEAKLSERFTKAGVVMAAGAAYHAEQAGYFRLTFAAEDGRVEEGIRRCVWISWRATVLTGIEFVRFWGYDGQKESVLWECSKLNSGIITIG
jgi:hypothetical protein